MKIGIYYIATGQYKDLFKPFIDSVHNFCPGIDKIVYIISDGLNEYDGYSGDHFVVKHKQTVAHYPWPVVALYKMWHILQNLNDTAEEVDYAFYFNANSILHENDYMPEPNTLYVSWHGYNCRYDPCYFLRPSEASISYIKDSQYEYAQSAFFGGDVNIMKEMCQDVVDMIHVDQKNRIFALMHDESYLCKWCHDNMKRCHYDEYLTYFPWTLDGKKKFVLLTYKDAEYDKFKWE